MREFTIGKNDAGQRLDRFVAKNLPLLPPALLQKYIRLKRIKVNGKEAIFDAIDTVELSLPVFGAMLESLSVRPKNMAKAAAGGFINATDCADYLTKKGLPFREAYMIVGRLVNMCTKTGDTLDTLTLKDFQAVSPLFDNDVYHALALKTCVNGRKVYGGPSKESVEIQIQNIEQFVSQHS